MPISSPELPALVLVADDFTGAADVAAGACGQWQTRLTDWRSAGQFLPPGHGQAFSINTGSRHLAEREAVQRLEALLARLPDDAWFYKKCDSTLRGNIGAEIAATRARFPRRQCVYAGAAPEAGRTVVGGELLVRGVPVARTDFGRDPLFPVRSSSILTLLEQAGLEARIWQGEPHPWPEAEVVVADVLTSNDLEALARRVARLPVTPVFAGAGSLVRFLALAADRDQAEPPPVARLPVPSLVVNGSLHPVSLTQVNHLADQGTPVMTFSPRCFFGETPRDHLSVALAHATDVERDESLTIRTAEKRAESEEYYAQAASAGIGRAAAHEIITRELARSTVTLLKEEPNRSLLTIGGELAAEVWRHLGMRQAQIQGFAHGCLPILQAEVPDHPTLTWATKPGGYGEADLLDKLIVG